jgi:hypothetical protein
MSSNSSAPAGVVPPMRITFYGPGQLPNDAPAALRPKCVTLQAWADLETFLRDHETVGAKEAGGYVVLAHVLPGPRCDANCEGEQILQVDYEPIGAAHWGGAAWPCSYIAHATASHLRVTKKNPTGGERWRVFLQMAEPLHESKGESKAERDAAVARITKLCPPGSVIRSVSQPAYLPTRPTAEAPPVEYRSDDTRGALDWRELVEGDDAPSDTDALDSHDDDTERKIDPESEPDAKRVGELAEGVASLWPETNRHFTSMALAGVLYHSAWRHELCEGFAEKVLEITESNTADGLKCFADTFDAAERGDPIKGVPKFRELLAYGCEFVDQQTRDAHFAGLTEDVQLNVSWRWFLAGLLATCIRERRDQTLPEFFSRCPKEGAPLVPAPTPTLPKAPSRFRRMGWSEINAPLGEVPWLCEGLGLVPGRPFIVVGKAGKGKTMTVQDLAMSVATGTPVFGRFPVRQGDVIHVDLDQGEHLTRQRYQQLARGRGVDAAPIELATSSSKLDDPATCRELREMCRGKVLCIIDCLRNASSEEENSSAFAAPLATLAQISAETGCTFIVLHHSGKGEGRDDVDILRGTSAIAGAAGVVMRVDRDDAPGAPARVSFLRGSGYDDRPEPFLLELVRDGGGALKDPATPVRLQWHAEGAGVASESAGGPRQAAAWTARQQRALEAVRATPGIKRRALRDKIGGDSTTATKIIDALVAGANECLGDRIWYYGPQSGGGGYFAQPATELVLAELANGPAIDAQLASRTQLSKATVKDALAELRATGHVNNYGSCNGEPAWQRPQL